MDLNQTITPEEMRDMAADLDRVAESLTHSGWVFAPKNCTRAAAMLRSIAAEREAESKFERDGFDFGSPKAHLIGRVILDPKGAE